MATPVPPTGSGGADSGSTIVPSDLEIFPLFDIIFTDLETGLEAFDIEIEAEFGESPTASMTSLAGDRDFLEFIRSNLS
jgi:hypothetical protein